MLLELLQESGILCQILLLRSYRVLWNEHTLLLMIIETVIVVQSADDMKLTISGTILDTFKYVSPAAVAVHIPS